MASAAWPLTRHRRSVGRRRRRYLQRFPSSELVWYWLVWQGNILSIIGRTRIILYRWSLNMGITVIITYLSGIPKEPGLTWGKRAERFGEDGGLGWTWFWTFLIVGGLVGELDISDGVFGSFSRGSQMSLDRPMPMNNLATSKSGFFRHSCLVEDFPILSISDSGFFFKHSVSNNVERKKVIFD